ncbi:hypothetical protein MPSEU_000714200 [Mayamaea pseudoterrestris]|nr:hypothetical protein MPSEU_000714200 [Mayamaea pseudoterrestris]
MYLLDRLASLIGDDNCYCLPLFVFLCVMSLFHLPILIYKLRMLLYSILYFCLSFDKSWKDPQDPGAIFGPHLSKELPVQCKTIYFIRHGESCWNETFNKGAHRSWQDFAVGFIPGLIKACLYEIYLLLSGKLDSWFYDSPLSHLGLAQIEELHTFIENKSNMNGSESLHLKVLRGDPDAPKSKLVSSGLRRASSTIAGCFRDRLSRRPDDKIVVISSLQEISRNPDTLSITPAQTTIQASWIEKHYKLCNFQDIYDNQTDMSLYTGNKSITSYGLLRMNDFCDFVFSTDVTEEHVIVGGHSIWFRSFFNMFLPFSVQHPSKSKKIVNGGVIAFDLMKAETKRGSKYMIDPKTVRIVYGGF